MELPIANVGVGGQPFAKYAALRFVVKYRVGQDSAYVYFEDEPGWHPPAKLLSGGEVRWIAVFEQGAVMPRVDRSRKGASLLLSWWRPFR